MSDLLNEECYATRGMHEPALVPSIASNVRLNHANKVPTPNSQVS